jgi:hypothetical protein
MNALMSVVHDMYQWSAQRARVRATTDEMRITEASTRSVGKEIGRGDRRSSRTPS